MIVFNLKWSIIKWFQSYNPVWTGHYDHWFDFWPPFNYSDCAIFFQGNFIFRALSIPEVYEKAPSVPGVPISAFRLSTIAKDFVQKHKMNEAEKEKRDRLLALEEALTEVGSEINIDSLLVSVDWFHIDLSLQNQFVPVHHFSICWYVTKVYCSIRKKLY